MCTWKRGCPGLLILASVAAPGQFIDITERSGIRFQAQSSRTTEKYLIESMVGGVALIDFDGDGWLDIFFVNGARISAPMPAGAKPDKSDPKFWNRLYRNNRDGTFADVTDRAGLRGEGFGMGVACGDFDNDGRVDLYVTAVGGNTLYRNNGDGTFSDITRQAGVGASGWSTGAAFVDYDRDGLLDLIVARYLEWSFAANPWCGAREPGYRSYCHPTQFKPITHLLFHNEGDGHFRDVSNKSGIGGAPGAGLGVSIADANSDGWPDILIANDSAPQQLFINRQNGTFEETGLLSGVAFDDNGETFAGMGIDFADYDNDGRPDVFINALANQRYALFRNQKGTFEYVSGPTGVGALTAKYSGWGAKFFDFDLDGWKDIFVAQGHVMDNIELTQPSIKYLEPPLLLRNRSGRFEDVSRSSGSIFIEKLAARGAAFGDVNNDGAIDVVISCLDQPARVLRNTLSEGRHWLLIRLIGTKSNRDGIGAAVRVIMPDGSEQHATATPSGSYLSSSDLRVHFGLGLAKSVPQIEVQWPGGVRQILKNVRPEQVLTIEEPGQKQ